MFWRAGPENKAVPVVYRIRILRPIDNFVEDGIDTEAREVWGTELGFLLGIAGTAMSLVARLDLSLSRIRKVPDAALTSTVTHPVIFASLDQEIVRIG